MAVTYDVSNGRKFTDEPTLDVLVDGSAILLVHTEKGVKSLRADALSKFITGDLTGLNTSDKSGLIAAINEVLGVTGDNGRAITALQTLTKMLSATGASRANSFIYEYDLGTSFTNDQSADIIAGKGVTEFGIGGTVASIVSCILHNERRVISVSAHLRGEYGEDRVSVGVPCLIGSKGIEKVYELELSDDERAALHNSCEIIREGIGSIGM